MTMQKQEYQEPVDVIVIIGQDGANKEDHKNFAKQITADCTAKKLKYLIVGDGEKSITLQDIKNLPETANLLVLAHGNILQDTHTIDNKIKSLEFLQMTQAKTQCKNIVYCSCYGGKVFDDMRKDGDNVFLDGTFIFAPSSADEPSLHSQNTKIISNYIGCMHPGTNPATFEFVQNSIKRIHETFVIGFQLQEKFESTTLLRKARGLDKTFFDIKKFGEYQLTIFNEFINMLLRSGNQKILARLKTEFPDYDFEAYKSGLDSTDKSGLLKFSMTQEEEKDFQLQSLVSLIAHNDIDVMDSLLSQNKFEPLVLMVAIAYPPPEKSFQSGKMVEIILKHKDNAILGTNANNFCPDASMSDYVSAFREYGFLETLGLIAYSPLTLALKKDKIDVVKVLIEQGADIYQPDGKHTMPVDMLHADKYKSLFIVPLKEANTLYSGVLEVHPETLLDGMDYSRCPSLQHACNDILQKRKTFQSVCNQENDDAFFQMQSSLPKNSKVYAAFHDYITAATKITPTDLMTFALDNKLQNVISELVKTGLYPDVYNAAINNNMELIKAYFYGGKNANLVYQHGVTLLCYAVAFEHADVIKELLKNNALLATSPFQNQLLQIAASHASPEIQAIMANAGFTANDEQQDLDELFLQAVKYNEADIATKLIKWGANPDKLDHTGKAAIHHCALDGNFELVKWLYHWKADLNVRDANGFSALQLAASKSKAGDTPESERKNYINIIRTLIRGGTNLQLDTEAFIQLNLSNALLVNNNFTNINCSGTNLSGASLKGTVFTNANLTGVNFIAAKDLTVDQLVSASSIMDIKIDTEYLKTLDQNQLNKLMNKAVQDYKTFIINNDMETVITKLLEIINDETHLLKFSTSFGIAIYRNTDVYTNVIEFGRNRILGQLKNQNPWQELNNELQNKLKILFEAKVTTLNADFNNFFRSARDKKSQTEEFYHLSGESNRHEI